MGLNSILEARRVRTDFLTNASRRLSLAALSVVIGLASAPALPLGFASTSHAAEVTTYHNDAQRPQQTVTVQGKTEVHDVVYVATENDTTYIIDTSTGDVLLSAHFGTPVPESVLPGKNAGHIGIRSTPVIDTATGTMYVITYTFENSAPVFRIHALNLEDLTDKVVPPPVIAASQKLSDGKPYCFRPHNAQQRSALLEANGNIYAGFASFGDLEPNLSRGWLLGWQTGSLKAITGVALPGSEIPSELTDKQSDAQTPPPSGAFNNFFMSSIWMSGYGVAADSSGDLYFMTGNSDPVRANNIQESAVKMSPDLTSVKDSFTPANFAMLD